MRNISCLILTGILVLIQACSPTVARKPVFDVLEPASVLTLEQDTTIVLVRDYFPSLDKIDRTESPHLKVVPYHGQDTVMLILREDTPLMTVLHVNSKGQAGDIPVRKITTHSEKSPRLAVFPALPDTDALCTIRLENGPATLYLFWQNSLVQTVRITDSYNVLLPGFTALMDRSWIRVYAVNQSGNSNDLLIPLEKGRPVLKQDQIRRSDKQA